ncbi:hypothetical protein [Streptantibioticus ferralitis]|uniref:Integral membrane protein n=1 Tax=Streptantibioticus ferralitis TaxID=236510 RepID=A0ABT5YZ81_9ACTN|nr:hypothetical protein [Streptantibioticus ferralitis]MDF2256803.1 hypothetical protein [Streptantibioticus ferralitis]
MAPSEPDGGQGPPGPREGEPGELEALRRRISRLEAAAPPAAVHHRLRTTGSVLLITLASVLSLLAVLSVWASNEVADTDRYVATVAPLAGNPTVQDAATNRITGVVLHQIDVNSLVNQLAQAAGERGVPPRAASLIKGLSGPIAKGLTSLIHDVVHRVVTSKQFATIWADANRAAHKAIDKALTGKGGGSVRLVNDQVAIDVGPAVARVKDELVSSGFGAAAKIPPVHTRFVVFSSPDIAKLQTYFRLLEIAGDWLAVVAVLIAAIGVLIAANRRRALIGAALGVAAAMLVLGLALAVFRAFYLDHLPPEVSQAAAGAVYDALVRFLRQAVRAVGVLALVVAIGAFLIGPSRAAVAIRSAGSTGIGGVRGVADSLGFRAGPVESFVRRYKRWIGAAVLLIAAVVFIFWSHPTAVVVFWFAVVVLGAFGIREFLAPASGHTPTKG